MNDDFQSEELLKSVFEEAASPEFRAALLQRTLSRVRWKRRWRRAGRGAIPIVCLTLAAMLVLRLTPSRPEEPQPEPLLDPLILASEPLADGTVIRTAADSVEWVRSSAATVAFVGTAPARELFEIINDEQLLALLADKSPVLIRRGPFEAEILFLDNR